MYAYKEKKNIYYSLLFFLILSLYIGEFNISVGFSLKPYMVITVISLLISIKTFSIKNLYLFESMMLVFIAIHSMTIINFKYTYMSIRFIILYVIIIFFYFLCRFLLTKVTIKQVEEIISITGLMGSIISIAYYLLGVFSSGLDLTTSQRNHFGLMIERSTPRLTGTASHDPNIFVFYFTMYFFYTLNNLENKRNKIGLFLVSLTIVLTFSRGGYLGILFGLIIMFLTSNEFRKNIRLILSSLMIFLGVTILGSNLVINPIDFIIRRFSRSISDGGSGRIGLWLNAIETFKKYPIFGIGINSIASYNLENYMRRVYVHNTFIEILVETGIIGFSVYLIFWFLLLKKAKLLFTNGSRGKYLFFTLLSMVVQMNALSVLYNEVFYFAILLVFRYSYTSLDDKKVRITSNKKCL